jgi:hypothetical protein
VAPRATIGPPAVACRSGPLVQFKGPPISVLMVIRLAFESEATWILSKDFLDFRLTTVMGHSRLCCL